jgi:hypothetical protein
MQAQGPIGVVNLHPLMADDQPKAVYFVRGLDLDSRVPLDLVSARWTSAICCLSLFYKFPLPLLF